SSSNITSVHGDDRRIQVQLESPTVSPAVLKVHLPSAPIKVTMNGKDYTTDGVTMLQDLAGMSHGWYYQSDKQMLTLKLTSEGASTITIEFPEQIFKDTREPTNLLILEIVVGSAVVGLILMFVLRYRQKILMQK
ncbi:MAG: hypothetical protein ACRD5H_14100, partial [Nitrososphaerales archaeon]